MERGYRFDVCQAFQQFGGHKRRGREHLVRITVAVEQQRTRSGEVQPVSKGGRAHHPFDAILVGEPERCTHT